jgi:CubicO group peptidase (beta-lactamase class C family)
VIHGEVAAGFEGVRESFERGFTELGETGAAYTALVDGRPIADLWGGEGFERDSLVHVYSVTKPMAAFCVLMLADRGVLGLDDAVGRHWPEFAQAGKAGVTVRQVLSHQAGLVALRNAPQPETILDWDRTCERLAAEPPLWEPGTAHAEHTLFYGHLCGELVRRADGRSLGTFWREEVAGPWGLDFHIGLGAAERARTVDLIGTIPGPQSELDRLATSNAPGGRDLAVVNGEAWRAAEIPAVNGHGTAKAVARFYAGLVAGGELDGVRLVSPAIVSAMRAGELTAYDRLLEEEITWGLGVWVDHDGYGMGGLGGSLGMADPALGLAEAYVTRQMADDDDGRFEAMDAAVRASVA